jgi:predicted nicotinamide N-methyase
VIELGCGTGIVGIVAALLGATVTVRAATVVHGRAAWDGRVSHVAYSARLA